MKTNRIKLSPTSRMSQKIRDAIAKYDLDGDGILDMDEVSSGHLIQPINRCHDYDVPVKATWHSCTFIVLHICRFMGIWLPVHTIAKRPVLQTAQGKCRLLF